MDPITQSAAGGFDKLILDYGLAGIMLAFLLIGGAFVLRWFMAEFKLCHDSTKQALEKNTEAFQGVQIALAKLEVKLDK